MRLHSFRVIFKIYSDIVYETNFKASNIFVLSDLMEKRYPNRSQSIKGMTLVVDMI